MREIIEEISRLDTLCIPCINNGMPYVRLDEIGYIFESYGYSVDVAPIFEAIEGVMGGYKIQDGGE